MTGIAIGQTYRSVMPHLPRGQARNKSATTTSQMTVRIVEYCPPGFGPTGWLANVITEDNGKPPRKRRQMMLSESQLQSYFTLAPP